MTKHVRAAVLLGVALPAAAFAVSDVREQACEATAHRRASRLLRCMAGCRAREEEAAANGTAFDGAACEAACEARHPDTPRPGCPPAPIPSFDGIDARTLRCQATRESRDARLAACNVACIRHRVERYEHVPPAVCRKACKRRHDRAVAALPCAATPEP